jgi:ABC-type multidrug transport system fused ATPase/permease subunit
MDFSEVLPIYNRINEYLEFKPSEKKGLSDLNKDPVIRSEALCFSYDGKKEIYNDLNFVFEKSKSYGIVGRTGEGKSTIVKLLYGLWEPDSGNIFINEEKCSELEYDSISEMVTYVSAAPIVFNDTIFNNIAMYDDTVSSKDLYEVLKKVELYDEVCNMNGKIYSVIGDSGVTISSGQKQRIAIARALLSNRKIIILDEPTSALDIDTKNKITQTIFETFKDKILIIISHDDSLIEKCDKIVFLENGKFKEIFKESSPA